MQLVVKIVPVHHGGTDFVAEPGRLHLGGKGAERVDSLHFELPEEWAGLAISLYVEWKSGEMPAPITLEADGTVQVTRSLTGALAGKWMLMAVGEDGYKAYSRPAGYDCYDVLETDAGSLEIAPTLYEQFVNQVLSYANSALNSSKDAAASAAKVQVDQQLMDEYAAAAAASAEAAAQSESGAADAALAAAAQATDAQESAAAAGASEANAAFYAEAAINAAATAGREAAQTTVATLTAAVAEAADAAATSQAAAAASEANAAASAASAAEYAAAAESSKTDSAASAEEAASSKNAAAASASAASVSENNAATSAATAASKATAASSSATAAAASKANAAESERISAEYMEQVKTITTGANGYYATPEALRAAVPLGSDGWWAVVGSTDTIWVWDSDTGGWVDSHDMTRLGEYYTRAQTDALISAAKSVSYTISVPASGWTGTAVPYTNAVAVPGVTASTTLSDITLAPASVGNSAAETAAQTWSYLDTGAGTVTFYSDAKPTADFTIIAREVR